MHPLRPTLPSQPCPACGREVDPLRAAEVVAVADGMRYLCDDECRARFVAGERDHESRRPPMMDRARRDPATGIIRTRSAASLPPLDFAAPEAPKPASPPWIGIGLAVAGAGVAFFASSAAAAIISGTASIAAVIAAAAFGREAEREIGLAAWLAAPLGAGLATIGAILAAIEDPASWLSLVGASLAAAVVNGRAYLDMRARAPVEAAAAELRATLPPRARIPVDDGVRAEIAVSEVDASSVRTGEEVLVVAGERVPVDATVVGGEGAVVPHASARLPVARRLGDPVLAGARVTEGALRLRATRVGLDRAAARAAWPDGPAGLDSPAVARARRLTFFGGLAAAGAATVALGFGEGVPAALAAAGAVLLGAPLASLWRAATLPLSAASVSACARGIVFPSGTILERAGRTFVCALCTRGTVTEGKHEVTQMLPIGDAQIDRILALVVGAELAAEAHPLARGIAKFAAGRGVAAAPVRRATSLPGRGVIAVSQEGETLVIGNRQLLLERGVSIAVADKEAARAEARGDTVLFVGVGGHVRAIIAAADPARPGARAAVQRLFDLGIEVVLLSGDHRGTVATLAAQLDVVNVRAELLPEGRAEEVRRLRQPGGEVAVVGHPSPGDGAYEAADVLILLGAAGSATDERTVALTTVDPRDAAAALFIARAAHDATARATLAALAIGGVLVVAAALSFVAPFFAALVGAAIDAYALPSGARLLRRVELRVPAPA